MRAMLRLYGQGCALSTLRLEGMGQTVVAQGLSLPEWDLAIIDTGLGLNAVLGQEQAERVQ